MGLLEMRKAARARAASPEQNEAREKMTKLAAGYLDEAGKAKAKDDPIAEREALTRAFFATLDKAARKPMIERLDELAKKTTFSSRFTADGEIYTVKQGDRLINIARTNKTTWAFVKRVNGLKTDSIRVGQKLKIVKGVVELSVFKTDFQIVVTIGGQFVRAFDVGTGREDRTPEQTFKIAERLEKPTWYAPDGKVYPFGTKENILGTRWMGFEKTEDFVGFGIHGTAFPETIGTESSAGCIRMRNEEVEELYDYVAEGTLVTIVR
jgi:lipoprotein-anchoring transpeptidase ErfK/SrfK